MGCAMLRRWNLTRSAHRGISSHPITSSSASTAPALRTVALSASARLAKRNATRPHWSGLPGTGLWPLVAAGNGPAPRTTGAMGVSDKATGAGAPALAWPTGSSTKKCEDPSPKASCSTTYAATQGVSTPIISKLLLAKRTCNVARLSIRHIANGATSTPKRTPSGIGVCVNAERARTRGKGQRMLAFGLSGTVA